MNLLRRMMMETKPIQDWDIVWDYTMGFPEDNGFTLTSLYTNVEPEITQDGVLYVPPHNVNVPYYELTPTGYNICNDGIFEVSVLVRQFTNYEHGIRLMISNGTSGIQIYVYNGILHYQSRVTKIPIADIVKNVWYTYRIERSSNKNTVYLNGDMIYESEYLSNQYNTKTRLIFQNGGEYLLKFIKFKKIS